MEFLRTTAGNPKESWAKWQFASHTFHRDANGDLEVNFRGYLPDDAEGLPSTHVPVPVPGGQGVEIHVDNRYPYKDVAGFAEHTGSVVKTIIQTLPH